MTAKETLAIVGFSARAAAQCAKQFGMRTIVIDQCNDRDTEVFSDDYLLFSDSNWETWLKEKTSDFRTTLLLTGGMENQPEVLQGLARIRHLCSVPSQSVLQCRDVARWRSWAERGGILFPNTLFAQDSKLDCCSLFANTRSWLIKNKRSAGGLQIRRHASNPDTIHPDTHIESLGELDYLQEYLEGRSIGVSFVSSRHGTLLIGAMTNVTIGPNHFMPEFTYSGSSGPVWMAEEERSKLERFAQLVSIESGLVGLWEADFIRNQTGLHLIEINPRWSASMELYHWLWNIPLTQWHACCLQSSVSSEDWDRWSRVVDTHSKAAGSSSLSKTIWYAESGFEVSSEQSNHWFQNRWLGTSETKADSKASHRYADIPRAGTYVEPKQPILSSVEFAETR